MFMEWTPRHANIRFSGNKKIICARAINANEHNKMDYIGLECVNGTAQYMDIYSEATIAKTVALGMIDLVVVIGNSLVITAVITTRKLRTVTNIFIVSLACADLMLGFAVMPFSISYEVVKIWIWGPVWCSMWLAIDVWLCTASILSLCAISLDRYVAVTHPIRYPSLISPLRGKILVSSVWILSFVICLPPLLGWNDGSTEQGIGAAVLVQNTSNTASTNTPMTSGLMFEDINDARSSDYYYDNVISNMSLFENYSRNCQLDLPVCELTPTKGYRIYASMGSFYLPSLIMMFFYLRIYLTAVKTAASIRSGVLLTKSNEFPHHHGGGSDDAIQLRVHRGGSTMSNSRNSATNDSTRYHSHDRYSTRSLSPCSARRSDPTHISSNGALPTRHDTANDTNKNNNNPSKSKHHSIMFWAHLGKRRNKSRLAINSNQRDSPQTEFINFQTNVVINGTDRLRTNPQESNTRTCIKRSPKRCKMLIKEGKNSSFNSKGHARKFHREAKAAKTLAIIVGAFIVCWCPFFTIYLIGAFCQDCVSDIVFSVFFWLGYINSALNPCIYALFARDFRAAFRRIILCKRRKGFSQATRADFITGTRKTVIHQQEMDSLSD